MMLANLRSAHWLVLFDGKAKAMQAKGRQRQRRVAWRYFLAYAKCMGEKHQLLAILDSTDIVYTVFVLFGNYRCGAP